jgi:hypothetical protein
VRIDHSPRSSAEVKNGGAIPPIPYMYSWRCATILGPGLETKIPRRRPGFDLMGFVVEKVALE